MTQEVAEPTKDLVWNMAGTEYRIRNVPYEVFDVEEEEVVSLEVAMKLEMIRELMFANKIPNAVNYELVADLEVDF